MAVSRGIYFCLGKKNSKCNIIHQKLKEYIVFKLEKICPREGKIKHIVYVTRHKQIILHEDKYGKLRLCCLNLAGPKPG